MSAFVKFFSTPKGSRNIVRSLLNHPNHINIQASKFTENDVKALRVNFKPASEDLVIPDEKIEDFPENFICPKINRDVLSKEEFEVREISDFSGGLVQTFFDKLHFVTRSPPGIPESSTDDLVDDLLRIARLNNYPFKIAFFKIRLHSPSKLYILNEPYVSATPDFVVKKGTISMVATEDKSLRNVDPKNHYGEMQIAGEILACGDENIRETGEISDQVLFAVRFISTYVTFYKAKIPVKYWKELGKGLPKKYSVAIKRWPGENKKLSGLDLANPEGRIAVLTALSKIRQFLLK
ncbi:13926_t:CDS:2 [Racocetra fulgida]|uniref:13926_t:CDS:1 n=1 Tax=Racocetra fulgida TaxID=60492 RepID=A0A9N8ZYI8_9GLOM|nr:13926_t:CDS:2 [Racocetra fulgida]